MSNMLRAFGVITILSIIGKLLGFGREALIAAYFGTSPVADVFFMANIIPLIMFTAIGTAIQAGIIPLYMKDKEKGHDVARNHLNSLGTIFIWTAVAFSLVTFIFADIIMELIAPGFSEEQLELGAFLTRILAPTIVLLTFMAISTGVLHSRKHFLLPALSPAVQNVFVIVAIIFLSAEFGVVGLAIGVLAGVFIQFVIQYPPLQMDGFRMTMHFSPELKRRLVMFIPIIAAALFLQLNDVVDRIITSTLSSGSVAAINYASRLVWIPVSLIMTPLITVFYPSLVEKTSAPGEGFIHMVKRGMFAIFLIAVPFEIVMLLEGKHVVEFAFQRGVFGDQALNLTWRAFFFFAVALPFFALRDFLMNALYAVRRFKAAMFTCLIGLVVNAGLSLFLASLMGIGGVALATSISMIITVTFLFFTLKGIYTFYADGMLVRVAKVVPISIVAWFGGYVSDFPVASEIGGIIISSIVVFLIYGVLLWLGDIVTREDIAELRNGK
ncbi:murein biosynthesis integral membrane protein MurJ [Virgibacillus siamensis]|uniref:murein biosynthesis integral membrane protein MurJ n=1 Tax=Virgibacillus siamensis TaxID=480071 RepID=UPI000986F087|nr:murein biosynthesis integral membrane protein MurJ [Virgibacillus siamensis]